MTENKESNSAIIIPIKGLSDGVYTYNYSCGYHFFNQFGNQEILDAHTRTTVILQKDTHLMRLHVTIQGSVVRSCDRCLGDVVIPLSYQASIIIQFSEQIDNQENDEIITILPTATQINLSQYVYDSVCVTLPLQSIHPPGLCDPIMEKKLSQLTINP